MENAKNLSSNLYSSGEFQIPVPDSLRHCWNAMAVFNENLHLFCGTAFGITQTKFDLRQLTPPDASTSGNTGIQVKAVTDPKNWPTTLFDADSFNTGGGACAFDNDAIWLFNGRLMGGTYGRSMIARKYSITGESQTEGWSAPLKLMETDDTTPIMANVFINSVEDRAVAATIFGKCLIFAYICLRSAGDGSQSRSLYVAVYDSDKINTGNNTWAASSMLYLSLADFAYYQVSEPAGLNSNLTFSNVGSNVDIDWFSTLDNNGKIQFHLALSTIPEGIGAQTPPLQVVPITSFLPLTVDETTGQVAVPAQLAQPLTGYYAADGLVASSLRRDPAGRLKACLSPLQSDYPQISARYYDTSIPPGPQTMAGAASDPITLENPWNHKNSTEVYFGALPPRGLFYVFAGGKYENTASTPRSIGYPVLEFLFGYRDNNCYGMVNLYGSIEVVEDTRTPKNKPGEKVSVISGIIDGPIPIPLENFKAVTLEGKYGMLTYGSSATTSHERKASSAWTVGFKSSGETSKGIGPAWDIAVKGGMGQASGSTQEETLSFSATAAASFEPASSEGPAEINPYGLLQTVSAAFTITAYRFRDANGNLISDATDNLKGSAPQMATVLATLANPGGMSYKPPVVVPGKLETYTPEYWNSAMQARQYAGKNYFGDVICANSYPFGIKTFFLSYTWTEGNLVGQNFNQFQSSFTENTWSFSLEAYAGISTGEGLNLFGIGEEMEAKFMVGGGYDHESSDTTTTQTEWGIELADEWGPPISQEPDSVSSYSFRVYFLPVPKSPSNLPPTYWTTELRQLLGPGDETKPADIDPNSGCWRIVFVVTEIIYRDPHKPRYLYDGSLDRSSVYPYDESKASGKS
jgi:hypothetical protein